MIPKPYRLKWQNRDLALGKRTCIMGILNITPDSFSDGGRYLAAGDALARARQMVNQGADIIDIGGESSRPFSEPVNAEAEISRVIPVIERLADQIDVPISVDTTKAEVARRAVSAGAAVINDISALRFDPDMGLVAAETGAVIVLMHMLGTPKTMQVEPRYDDLIGEVHGFFETAVKTARDAGILHSRIILDPGVGFGKTVSHNLELIKNLHRFSDLDAPLLVGASRKAFIRKILARENFLETEEDTAHESVETGTQAAVSAAILNGAHIVRVHDVAMARTTAAITDAVKNAPPFS